MHIDDSPTIVQEQMSKIKFQFDCLWHVGAQTMKGEDCFGSYMHRALNALFQ